MRVICILPVFSTAKFTRLYALADTHPYMVVIYGLQLKDRELEGSQRSAQRARLE
jgi:hypothetical protein